ncbi:HAD-IA family hydrolase [Gammaproteobacteria bacterium]|nr:HAD-IA family hydrolase [Gammaproteobacteria bacterium]MDA9112373.1 HAD-IA family hydrolase [Gammaproteobacteria bacterium]MDB4059308.1 HAD-IA family hydrolase [Gammaproteobacteria bacterium]MDC1190672.1 HAD-IA family hydrolase [Gammaproteobacteria bacterium]MDC1491659.1 HAD-IA family hydrolase [Gammaproteobacteria bacterium]
MKDIKAVFWDFGGVITTSPFDSFNAFEATNNLDKDFIRKVNSTNPDINAWAKLERNEIDIVEFNDLFFSESSSLGHGIYGIEVIKLLQGQLRPEMIKALKAIQGNLVQACLTNNIVSPETTLSDENVSIAGKNNEVMGLFDFVIASSEQNVRKPDPAFYHLALKEAKVDPEEAVFLDDLGINLKPAKTLGMHTIKVVNSQDALKELNSLLFINIL